MTGSITDAIDRAYRAFKDTARPDRSPTRMVKLRYEVRCTCGEPLTGGETTIGKGMPYSVMVDTCDNCENRRREERLPGSLFGRGPTVSRTTRYSADKHVTVEVIEVDQF